jgi:transposase-like protein
MSMSLIDVTAAFSTEEKCLDYLEAMRWPDGVACIACGSVRVSTSVSTVKARRATKTHAKGEVVKSRRVYDCAEKECGHQFTATAGTVFNDTHLPLRTWFIAIALMLNAKKSLSALQLQRDLGLGSYRTAWYLAHRIRKAMAQPEGMFSGQVEADETYVGGKFDKRRKRERYAKPAVGGLLQRGKGDEHSKVKTFNLPVASAMTLTGMVRDNVSMDAELLCTDEARGYVKVGREYKRHEVVNHIKQEYAKRVDGFMVSTNGIENFWSLFKRSLVGQFHSISVKHLPKYLDETTYKFNNREDADLFARTMAALLATIALPYAELVSDPSSTS